MEAVNAAFTCTDGENESASEMIGRAVRELGAASAYDDLSESGTEQAEQLRIRSKYSFSTAML